MKLIQHRKYQDKFGQVWEVKFNEATQEFQLWREKSGWGNWNNGQGLTLLERVGYVEENPSSLSINRSK